MFGGRKTQVASLNLKLPIAKIGEKYFFSKCFGKIKIISIFALGFSELVSPTDERKEIYYKGSCPL